MTVLRSAPAEDRSSIIRAKTLLDADDITGMFAAAVSSGKTTPLNALVREFTPEERLILIEDTSELHPRHANSSAACSTREPR